MNLTLNDFRNILGKVNDGDAVFTKDNNGNATEIEQREDAALLGAAVAALRNAPDDAQLVAAKPAAAKDFAAVDRKADKFDLSLGALKNFFKGDE